MQRFVVYRAQQGLVIFINQHDHWFTRLFTGTPDHALEAQGQGGFIGITAIDGLPLGKSLIQHLVQIVGRTIFVRIQIQVQHGIPFPLRIQSFKSQSFEQFIFT